MNKQIKNIVGKTIFALLILIFSNVYTYAQNSAEHECGKNFKQGKFGMFIHWGIYSQLANRWKDSTYYGASEWIKSKFMANISTNEYMNQAKNFNPQKFNAQEVVNLAKKAGMKYIVITAKHHDGFAMYNSEINNFNIVKASPYAKDPMNDLANACKNENIGFGFYYSHNRDWTFSGGFEGPTTDENGISQTFDDYFYKKCRPQVEEITKNYGNIELIWFDTPGKIDKKYVTELVDIVRKNQPQALISGRIGHGLGDYETLGDMEMPIKNIEGKLWESIDVTNDSWGYAWYDKNWKTPKQIISNLVTAVARGGTYLLNIGPGVQGEIPVEVVATLTSVGKWMQYHNNSIYDAQPSPWKHKFAWGDATHNGNKLFLFIENMPANKTIYLHGLKNKITSAEANINGKFIDVNFIKNENNDIIFDLKNVEDIIPVVEISIDGNIDVDTTLSLDTTLPTHLSVLFAKTENCFVAKDVWMEKFGEHKYQQQIGNWQNNSIVKWNINVMQSGYYLAQICYKSDLRTEWLMQKNKKFALQNKLGFSSAYNLYNLGWIYLDAGNSEIALQLLNPNEAKAKLAEIIFTKIEFE